MYNDFEIKALAAAGAVEDPVDKGWRRKFDSAKFKFSHSGGFARCSVHVGDVAASIESRKGLEGLVDSVLEKMESGFIPTWKLGDDVRPWLESLKEEVCRQQPSA